MRTILITGANGFIGSALLRRFAANGWRTIGCGRHKPAQLPPGAQWREYDLASTVLPPDLLDGVDVLVHAAMIRGDFDTNVAGSTLLLAEAERHGVGHVVFLSSLAAHDGALSQYGRHKRALERLFAEHGALVVRPGLVIGEGGAFGAMCEYLRGHRFVPLIDGGRQPLQTVFIDDLIDAVYAAVEAGTRGTFTVAEDEPVAYRAFYEALSTRLGKKITFVPIPFWTFDTVLRAASGIGLRLPIDRDSLLGLRAMRADDGPRIPNLPARDYRANILLFRRSSRTG